MIGMARALLADPDLPKKAARAGQSDKIIWCTYGNVCKNLDENFRRVTCVLWPKGALQAPRSSDQVAPAWPAEGAALRAEHRAGQIFLGWNEADDNESVYGYEIHRSVNGGEFTHLATVKRNTHYDLSVAGGNSYRYRIVAYDLAGNRSAFSESRDVNVPLPSPAGELTHG